MLGGAIHLCWGLQVRLSALPHTMHYATQTITVACVRCSNLAVMEFKGGYFNAAKKLYLQAINSSPVFAEAYLNLGASLRAQSDVREI